MAKETTKIYGEEVRFVGKIVQVDDKPRTCDFGTYENMTVVPIIIGQTVDALDREIMGEDAPVEEESLKDSEHYGRIGTTDPKFHKMIAEFRQKVADKKFDECFVYAKCSSNLSKKEAGVFTNLTPLLMKPLNRKEIKENVERLKKANALWDGVFRPKETVVKSETTSSTYANAWD